MKHWDEFCHRTFPIGDSDKFNHNKQNAHIGAESKFEFLGLEGGFSQRYFAVDKSEYI